MKVGNSKVVEIHFTIEDKNGEVIEDTQSKEPYTYLHGANNIIEGLEDGLEQLEAGAEFDILVPPEKAYGPRDIRLIQEIPLNSFPKSAKVEEGEEFFVDSDQGPKPIYIKEVREKTVLVDGNHKLAGETLHYKGSILSVREADENELYHGQTNSSCCSGGKCSSQ